METLFIFLFHSASWLVTIKLSCYIFKANCSYLWKNVFYTLFSQSVPETWNKHVSDIIKRSQSERTASRKLRERIVTELAHAGKTLSDMWEAVNAALSQRIRELTDARNQIQASLGKVDQNILF